MHSMLITFPLVIIIPGLTKKLISSLHAENTMGGNKKNLCSSPVDMVSACYFQISSLVNPEWNKKKREREEDK